MALTLKIIGAVLICIGLPIFTVTTLAVFKEGNPQSAIAMAVSGQAVLAGIGLYAFGIVVQCSQAIADNTAKIAAMLQGSEKL